MKIRPIIIVVLSLSLVANMTLFYLYWTTRPDTTPIFDPFEINYNVTEKALITAGYTSIPEDVPLLGKQVGDTLIYYQLDYECSDATEVEDIDCKNTGVYLRYCIIYLDKVDSTEISRLANNYDAEIIGDFIIQTSLYDSNFLRANFSVRHKFTQAIFDCSIEKSYADSIRHKYELSIQTSFPWTKERVKTELENRQVGNEYYKFNEVLGLSKKDAHEFLLSNVERIVLMDDPAGKGIDPGQYVFETKKHPFTLYFVNDTAKYISVTFGVSTVGLMHQMSNTFGQDSLYDIQDEFLKNRINQPYTTAKLFVDKSKGFNYLAIVESDPQYLAQPSTIIVWRKK